MKRQTKTMKTTTTTTYQSLAGTKWSKKLFIYGRGLLLLVVVPLWCTAPVHIIRRRAGLVGERRARAGGGREAMQELAKGKGQNETTDKRGERHLCPSKSPAS